MPNIEVCFTPEQFGLYYTKQHTVVVIDVLRATSAICTAFQHGVKKVIPVSTVEEAKSYQRPGFLVGAERNGQIVEGFDCGNSPYSYMGENVKDKTVVLTTTNGTKAIKIASVAPEVIISSLLNLEVVITYLMEQKKDVLILCSGWMGKYNLEDTICAGALVDELLKVSHTSSEDSTIGARNLYLTARDNSFGFLKASSHRRRLRKLNLNKDIKYCLEPNQTPVIPVLKGDYLELI
jgi:2-phosphosulfolactate phosphatase